MVLQTGAELAGGALGNLGELGVLRGRRKDVNGMDNGTSLQGCFRLRETEATTTAGYNYDPALETELGQQGAPLLGLGFKVSLRPGASLVERSGWGRVGPRQDASIHLSLATEDCARRCQRQP